MLITNNRRRSCSYLIILIGLCWGYTVQAQPTLRILESDTVYRYWSFSGERHTAFKGANPKPAYNLLIHEQHHYEGLEITIDVVISGRIHNMHWMPNNGLYAEGTGIAFIDGDINQDSAAFELVTRRTYHHEIAHGLSEQLFTEDDMNNLKTAFDEIDSLAGHGFTHISEYSRINFDEEFAELAAHIFVPNSTVAETRMLASQPGSYLNNKLQLVKTLYLKYGFTLP